MNGYKKARYLDRNEVHLIGDTLIGLVKEHHPHVVLFDNKLNKYANSAEISEIDTLNHE